MAVLWLANLDNAGSEPGASVGPGAGRELMLLFVGRCWWAAWLVGGTTWLT
jgi:hypothetical protein